MKIARIVAMLALIMVAIAAVYWRSRQGALGAHAETAFAAKNRGVTGRDSNTSSAVGSHLVGAKSLDLSDSPEVNATSSMATASSHDSKPSASVRTEGLAKRPGSEAPKGSPSPRPVDRATLRHRVEEQLALYFQVVAPDDAMREKLIELATDRLQDSFETSREGRAMGLRADQIAQLQRDGISAYVQQIYALLGREQGQYFLDSSAASLIAHATKDFSQRCTAAGVPLTPVAQNSSAIVLLNNLVNPAMIDRYPRLPDGTLLADQKAINQASRVLNAEQLRIFKQLLSERPYFQPGG